MGSIRDRAGRECLGEANAIFGKSVERRGLNRFVTVAMDVIGAESVDGDQENFGAEGFRLLFASVLYPEKRQTSRKTDQNSSSLFTRFRLAYSVLRIVLLARRCWDIILPFR